MAKPLKALGKDIFGDTNTNTIRSGNWYGNDTTWRMVIDLNRILMYAQSSGCLQAKPARRMFCIVDGIVGGDGNGSWADVVTHVYHDSAAPATGGQIAIAVNA